MKRVVKDPENTIFVMANIPGRFIVHPSKQAFSFFFSPYTGQSHNIRVKVSFTADNLNPNKAGVLKLCDDWKFTPNNADKRASASDIRKMKQFFRTYLVIFCMVWDYQLPELIASKYFTTANFTLFDLIKEADFYEDNKELFENKTNITIEELEDICRQHDLVDFRDNK